MAVFLTTDSRDPWRNLAAERYLFTIDSIEGASSAPADHLLLLWSNASCVVIGRHQNPWIECNLPRMIDDGVPVVRRTSGGGAVYHDEGNLNFTFIGTGPAYSLDRHFAVVIRALQSLGISARRNERNDIVIGKRKISGSAFRHTRSRSLHHGTLLLSADLGRLSTYLSRPNGTVGGAPSIGIVSSAGIPSVRSSVTNLVDVRPGLTADELRAALAGAYETEYGSVTEISPGAGPWERRSTGETFAEYEREARSWEWRFGKTPAFSMTITVETRAGLIGLSVTVRHGRVDAVSLAETGSAARSSSAGRAVEPGIGPAVQRAERVLRGSRFIREDILERAAGELRHVGDLSHQVAGAIAEAAGPAMVDT